MDALVRARARLDTLVGALWTLEVAVGDGGAQGAAPWPEILAQFQSVATFTASLSAALSAPPPPLQLQGTDLQQAREQSLHQEAWKASLARLTVHPSKLPTDADSITALLSLLVTRQNTDIEEIQNKVLSENLSRPIDGADPEATAADDVERLGAEIKAHDQHVGNALEYVETFLNVGDDGEPFDWKMRLDLQEADDEEEEQGEEEDQMAVET